MIQDRALPSHISIHRTTNGDGEEVMRLELTDARSRTVVLTFEISPGDLMSAIAGKSHVPVQAIWTWMERLGKWMETKNELIETVYKPATREHYTPSEIIDMLGPFEVDGWKAKASDLNNGLRRVKERVVSVRFFRWIDKPEEHHAPT